MVAAAGVALAASAAGAQPAPPPPEPPVTLVSNLDTGGDTPASNFTNDFGQAFRSGEYARGYVVTSVAVRLRQTDSDTAGLLELSIWSADETGRPAVKLGVLAAPESLADGAWMPHVFTAPAGGIHLSPETTYVLVLDAAIDDQPVGFVVRSDSDDQSGQPGWTIADSLIYQNRHGDFRNWTVHESSLRIAIFGREAPPSPPFVSELNRQAGGGSAVVRFGDNELSPCDGSWRPSLSIEEVWANVAVFCNTRTGQWVKGSYARPGLDYARDDQLEEGSSLNGCLGGMLYDPLADECVSPSAPPR